jgi:hypothetical protein
MRGNASASCSLGEASSRRDVQPNDRRAARALGHDVVAVTERADLRNTSEEELLAAMAGEGRAIVSENAVHFVPPVAGSSAARTAPACWSAPREACREAARRSGYS